jgi:hypothetical protein
MSRFSHIQLAASLTNLGKTSLSSKEGQLAVNPWPLGLTT